MEELVTSQLQKFGDLINWTFTFTFLMVAYVVNQIAKNKLSRIKPGVPTWARSLIVGILLAVVFFLLSRKYDTQEIIRYLVSIAFSMFVLWDGLKKWSQLIKKTNGQS